MKKLLCGFLALLLGVQPALAQVIPSIPYNLTNGSLADATQVMGNFNTIVSDTNANAATSGINSNITSITGLTTPLSHSQGGTAVYTGGTTGGNGNAQTLTTTVPNNFALTAGNIVTGTAGFTNTSALTLNTNSTGVTAVDKIGATGPIALTGGEIRALSSYMFYFDGTEYIVLNPTLAFDGTNFTYNSLGQIAFGSAPALPNGTTATTQAANDNSTKVATTSYVNAIVNPPVYNTIAGFLPSTITGSSTTATITVSAGQTADSTNAVYISKSTTTSWALSNGNAINGYSGGTTLPSSATIHMYVCAGVSGVGTYAIPNSSYPLAATSCPTGYTANARRIFSFNTGASTTGPLAYTPIEISGGGTLNWLSTQTLDVNVSNLGTSRTGYTLNVPLGITVQPIIRAMTGSSADYIIFTSGDETDVAPQASNSVVPLFDINNSGSIIFASEYASTITTNTSGQIFARSTGAGTLLSLVTRGWVDFRRN